MLLGVPRSAFAIEAVPSDSFLQYVRRVVDGEKDWPAARGGDDASVEAERQRLAHELFDGAEVVDLVGHSTPTSCCLKLGDWVLHPADAARLASYLPKSVKVVRLIGCQTASTDEGRAAAAAFTRCGLVAYGTLHKVYTAHFDRTGVKQGAGAPPLLGFFPDGRGPAAPRRARVARALARLRRIARGMLAVLCGLYWILYRWLFVWLFPRRGSPCARMGRLLHPRCDEMPGLLTEPLFVFEIEAGAELWTLEILFDFELARFYPSASAADAVARDLVYEIRGAGWGTKTPLEAYLERAPDGVTCVGRHAEAGDRCRRVPARGDGT